jgi:hypothetical protein
MAVKIVDCKEIQISKTGKYSEVGMEVLFKCGYVQHSFLCGRQTWKVSTQARADAVGSFFRPEFFAAF